MNYIEIHNGIPLRNKDINGRGHLHAIISGKPSGVIIEQSKDHGQIIQRVIYPNGMLVITYFTESNGRLSKLDEIYTYLWDDPKLNRASIN